MPDSNLFVQTLESRCLFSAAPAAPAVVAAPAIHADVVRAATAPLPKVFSINPTTLSKTKSQLSSNSALKSAYKALISSANSALKMAPVSVTQKTNPSGISSHDYVSYAKYYWPNPKTKTGLPYIEKDGDVDSKQVAKGDDSNWDSLVSAVSNLSVAYYLSGTSSYATQAAKLLEVWFIDSKTAMNPELTHAQIRLGIDTGSDTGILDFYHMYQIVDALGLISTSSAWTKADNTAMTAWMNKYYTWLTTSSFGKGESGAANNTGSWYDVQVMSIALYLGKTSAAKTLAQNFGPKRINTQIKSDGSQPLELARADGWAYSIFNLTALTTMADLASNVGVNLWTYKGSSGGTLLKALDYITPYANSKTAWPHSHNGAPLTQSNRNQLIPLLLEAQKEYGGFTKWLDLLPASTVASDEQHLFLDA